MSWNANINNTAKKNNILSLYLNNSHRKSSYFCIKQKINTKPKKSATIITTIFFSLTYSNSDNFINPTRGSLFEQLALRTYFDIH